MCDPAKEIVEQTYDEIADWYLGWIEGQRSPRERYASNVLENGPPAPRIFELGCGPGVPVMRMLLDRGAEVVADDTSRPTTQPGQEPVSAGNAGSGRYDRAIL